MAELGPDVLYVIEEQDPLSGDWQLSEDNEYTLSAAACASEAARWVPEAYAGVEGMAPGYRTRVVEYRRVGVVAGALAAMQRYESATSVFERIEINNQWTVSDGIPDGIPDGLAIMCLRDERRAAEAVCVGLGGAW